MILTRDVHQKTMLNHRALQSSPLFDFQIIGSYRDLYWIHDGGTCRVDSYGDDLLVELVW